ncbi:MAG TPA: DUF4412 domain-containing protein [Gemmatimonadales bacterium]|nr:DUF4412 domain-containing protein [Gemmatimonadales bacterium]
MLKRLTAATIAGTMLWSMPLAAQFEGTIDMTMGSKSKAKVTQSLKAGHSRTEMTQSGTSMVMLMDVGGKEVTMLMPEHQMYMKMSLKDDAMKPDKGDAKPPKITDTGKTETIAGKTCSVYRMAEEAGKPETMEICAAKGMGFFAMGAPAGPMGKNPFGNAIEAAANPEYVKLFKDGFFPLRITDISKGTPETVIVVDAINPKPIPDAAFQVPAGYTEMKMPGMPKRN